MGLKSTPKPPKTTPGEVPAAAFEMPRGFALKRVHFGSIFGAKIAPKIHAKINAEIHTEKTSTNDAKGVKNEAKMGPKS